MFSSRFMILQVETETISHKQTGKTKFITSDIPSNQPSTLVAFTYATFTTKHSRSCTGYCVCHPPNLVCARSITQSRVTTSSSKAELTAIYSGTNHLLYLQSLTTNLDEKADDLVLLTDSWPSVSTLPNNVSNRYRFLAIYSLCQRIHQQDES